MTVHTTSSRPPFDIRGSNASGVRVFNERLILSLVRRRAGVAKAEIARATGLSAQAVSVIVRALETDGLIERMAPIRGRVGQPSTPLRLAAEGAFSFGLKVGRRSADLVLTDFLGAVVAERHWAYAYPDPTRMLGALAQAVETLSNTLPPAKREKIVGLGVAMPFEIWNWAEQVGAPAEVLDAWRRFDVAGELSARLGLPVVVSNDATAACGAELTFGVGARYRDFVYFFIGSFAGGGLVLDGALLKGRRGNAGALGSMPVPSRSGGTGQLIETASLVRLETELAALGRPTAMLFDGLDGWGGIGAPLDRWIAEAARSLAHAVAASAAVVEIDAAIIDGWMPADVRARLAAAVREEVRRLDLQGLSGFEIVEGAAGPQARSIGAASLPLTDRFLLERDEALARAA